MELKKLFQKTFPEYYNVNSEKETHIYLSTAKEEIKKTIAQNRKTKNTKYYRRQHRNSRRY